MIVCVAKAPLFYHLMGGKLFRSTSRWIDFGLFCKQINSPGSGVVITSVARILVSLFLRKGGQFS